MADVSSLRISGNHFNHPQASAPSFTNHSLDATTDGVAFVFQARDTNPITHIGFRYGARTGTPPTYVATLEGVSTTTGAPDGSDLGGGSATAKTFTPPADATWDGTWQWIALTNSYTPTLGQVLCFTIRYSSGTVDASNFSSITRTLNDLGPTVNLRFPYTSVLTAGTWANSATHTVFGVRTAATRYGFIAESIEGTRTASTVGHRQAMKFTLPAGSGDTFKVRGVRFSGSLAGAAGKTPVLALWSGASALQNITLDTEQNANASISGVRTYQYFFDDSSTLSFGTTYYIGLEVADATNGGVILQGIGIAAAEDGDAYPGGASNFILSNYNGSSWTDDATIRPLVELILEDVTEPAGGGGAALLIGGSLVQ